MGQSDRKGRVPVSITQRDSLGLHTACETLKSVSWTDRVAVFVLIDIAQHGGPIVACLRRRRGTLPSHLGALASSCLFLFYPALPRSLHVHTELVPVRRGLGPGIMS